MNLAVGLINIWRHPLDVHIVFEKIVKAHYIKN